MKARRNIKFEDAGRLGFLVLLLVVVAVPPAAAGTIACPGDCNGNGISPEEIEGVARTIFDATLLESCPSADPGGNGFVTAANVVATIAARFDPQRDCFAASEPTATPTATAQPSDTPASTTTPTPTATATATRAGTPLSVWHTLTSLSLGPRQEVGVTALDDAVYVLGGFDAQNRGDAAEAYDVFTNRWMAISPMPMGRNHVGAGAAAGRVYAIGGFDGQSFNPVSTVFRYDPGTDAWDSVAPLPAARGAVAVAEVNGKLHVIGGLGASSASITRHDVYDPLADSWTERAPLPSARNHLAAATIDGLIYVIGGRGGPNTAELDRYDPSTNTWEVLTPMPTARSGLAAAAFSGRLVVMGGEVSSEDPNGVFPEVEAYDPATNTWVSLAPMPVPRHGIGAVTVGPLIYVPGGATVSGLAGATAHVDAMEIAF